MKDLIFIGWNKDNALAVKVKEILDKAGYMGVIGGEYSGNPDVITKKSFQTVNETIRYQMHRCSQAIMLYRGKTAEDDSKTAAKLSGNLIYEMGYLYSRYSSSRMHIFKINISKEEENSLLPSDLHGIWSASCEGAEDDAMAERIVDLFKDRQRLIPRTDLAKLVNHYHRISYEIEEHLENPRISDYELAKHLIVYVQGAYMRQKILLAQTKCKSFKRELHNAGSATLETALEFAMNAFDMFLSIENAETVNNKLIISEDTFDRVHSKYRKLIVQAFSNDENVNVRRFDMSKAVVDENFLKERGEVSAWIATQSLQHLSLWFMAYLDNPEHTADEIINRIAITYGEKSIENLLFMSKLAPENKGFANIMLGYSYRNVANFYRNLNELDAAKKNDEIALDILEKLYDDMENANDENPELENYIKLEYFLQVVDTLDSFSEYDASRMLREIGKYIKEIDTEQKRKNLMFDRLKEAYNNVISKE
ncbi:MAG: nucleotide-binding protein [Clostridia bacterium]|nr:nucleotide-binding protein [Clostridia bacterium]